MIFTKKSHTFDFEKSNFFIFNYYKEIRLTFSWVSGNMDIEKNCKVEQLVRQGTTKHIFSIKKKLDMPFATCNCFSGNLYMNKPHLGVMIPKSVANPASPSRFEELRRNVRVLLKKKRSHIENNSQL